jgi:23S rRNA (guanosine2251-2'-O)-methyltransferase
MSASSKTVLIALDNIRSHHNVGSVFRSADAFGIDQIILGGISPQPPHRDIQKTALGATESVEWIVEENLIQFLLRKKNEGFLVVSVEQDSKSTFLPEMNKEYYRNIILVFGNEVDGVSKEILDSSDEIWEIPQVGLKKSLNISVCAGICMHHVIQ